MKNANEVQMNMNSPAAQAMCNTAAGADVRDCGFQIIIRFFFLYLSDTLGVSQAHLSALNLEVDLSLCIVAP